MVELRLGDVVPADVRLLTKGPPEAVLERCTQVPESARRALEAEFLAGNRAGLTPVGPRSVGHRHLRRRASRFSVAR
ncbi:hypothetical protein ABT124_39195 [Streptomyces sp. NPDC001982]|uniref:hypothetical protein n=1 Tax=Streptomyces sp. NPDC001982 TaxID=3154405 RepID=UPI003321E9B8